MSARTVLTSHAPDEQRQAVGEILAPFGGIAFLADAGAYADPMAEHVLAMALALAKRLPRNQARMAEGIFDPAETLRLRGRTVGILGYGGIGRACARLFRPLGTRIYAINTSGRAD